MPFTGFDKKSVKESSSFAQTGHLPLQVHHTAKCTTEKGKRKKKIQTLEV